MPVEIPSTFQAISIAVASILGLGLTWYLGKQVVLWLQAYRTQRQKSEVEAAREALAKANQDANKESDLLRDIEGR